MIEWARSNWENNWQFWRWFHHSLVKDQGQDMKQLGCTISKFIFDMLNCFAYAAVNLYSTSIFDIL